jgi:hypothetical protein
MHNDIHPLLSIMGVYRCVNGSLHTDIPNVGRHSIELAETMLWDITRGSILEAMDAQAFTHNKNTQEGE